MVKVGYAFFLQKWINLNVMTIWSYSSYNRKQIALKVQRCPCPSTIAAQEQYSLVPIFHSASSSIPTRAATTLPPANWATTGLVYNDIDSVQFFCKTIGTILEGNCGSVAIVAYAVVFIQQKLDLLGDMTFCGNIQLKLLPNMLQLYSYFTTSLRKTIICQLLQKKSNGARHPRSTAEFFYSCAALTGRSAKIG
jgi:hypothetical protein